MRAMILAAGRGERMRPLTDHCPKPLLKAGGRTLIEWHIHRLVRAGIREIIINHAWLGEQITATLGDGSRYGARLDYSAESPALETAGGIAHALPFFRGAPFLVVNGDIWCDWDPDAAPVLAAPLSGRHQAHLVLVDNPPHHPEGDFALRAGGWADTPEPGTPALTFSGIALYHPSLFTATDPNRPAPLAPLLRAAMRRSAVTAEHHGGRWMDVGTPERLHQLDRLLASHPADPHT